MLSSLTLPAAFLVAQITYLIVDSRFLDWPRALYRMLYVFTCPFCISAWIAAATTLALHPNYPVLWWATIWWIGVALYHLWHILAGIAANQ